MNGPLDPTNLPQLRLKTRIEGYANNPPDVEYSLYGPINTLLHLYFPFDQYWMIKPQAPIRDLALGHGRSGDSQDRSVNPNGRQASPADFVVARFSGTGLGDVVNLLIEVKPRYAAPGSVDWEAAVDDLSKYIKNYVLD